MGLQYSSSTDEHAPNLKRKKTYEKTNKKARKEAEGLKLYN